MILVFGSYSDQKSRKFIAWMAEPVLKKLSWSCCNIFIMLWSRKFKQGESIEKIFSSIKKKLLGGSFVYVYRNLQKYGNEMLVDLYEKSLQIQRILLTLGLFAAQRKFRKLHDIKNMTMTFNETLRNVKISCPLNCGKIIQ